RSSPVFNRLARYGTTWMAVEPVPRPTTIPDTTRRPAASAAARFSSSTELAVMAAVLSGQGSRGSARRRLVVLGALEPHEAGLISPHQVEPQGALPRAAGGDVEDALLGAQLGNGDAEPSRALTRHRQVGGRGRGVPEACRRVWGCAERLG